MNLTTIGCLFSVLWVCVCGLYVEELDDSFIAKSTQGIWLVEFYAPWCGHCKRLEPIYEEVAKKMLGSPVSVGRIDCTRHSYAASHFHVQGFPTIQLFMGNQTHTHRGERTERGIIDFVNRAQSPAVRKLSSVGRYNEEISERGDDVYFIFAGDDDPYNSLLIHYETVAEEFKLQSYFYKGPRKILPQDVEVINDPAVLVFKDHGFREMLTPSGIVTKESLWDWVNGERFHAFPLVTGMAVNEMANIGKLMAMLTIDMEKAKESSERMKQLINAIATHHKEKYASKFQFLMLDDQEITNGIAMTTLELPNLLVLDPVSQYYYIPPSGALQTMTIQDVMRFFDDIVDRKIKAFGGTGFLQRLKRIFYEIYAFFINVWMASRILFFVIIGIPSFIIGLLVWACCCMDTSDDTLYDEDGNPITNPEELQESTDAVSAEAEPKAITGDSPNKNDKKTK